MDHGVRRDYRLYCIRVADDSLAEFNSKHHENAAVSNDLPLSLCVYRDHLGNTAGQRRSLLEQELRFVDPQRRFLGPKTEFVEVQNGFVDLRSMFAGPQSLFGICIGTLLVNRSCLWGRESEM